MATRIFCEARSERAAADAGAENGAAAILKPVETRAVVAFASARGGVGKSAICVNVAAALAMTGRKVAIVDADLNSPGVLGMLRLKPLRRFAPGEEIDPASGPLGIRAVASSQLADGEPVAFSFFETDDAAPPAPSLNGARPLEVDYRATLRRLLAARFGPLDLMLIDLASGLSQLHCLAEVVELMETHRIKRVPVIDGGALVGIISRANLVAALAGILTEQPRRSLSDEEIRQAILAEIDKQPWGPRQTSMSWWKTGSSSSTARSGTSASGRRCGSRRRICRESKPSVTIWSGSSPIPAW